MFEKKKVYDILKSKLPNVERKGKSLTFSINPFAQYYSGQLGFQEAIEANQPLVNEPEKMKVEGKKNNAEFTHATENRELGEYLKEKIHFSQEEIDGDFDVLKW